MGPIALGQFCNVAVIFVLLVSTHISLEIMNFREKEKLILDTILESESYDNRIRPSPVMSDSAGNVSSRVNAPTKVNVNTYLRSIDKIDDYKMEYSVQLTFRQSWLDPRLSYPNHDGQIKYLTMTDPEKVWMPDTFFQNEKTGHFHNIIVPNVYVRIYPNGKVLYSIRISLTLSCPMDLKLYPLDRQQCELRIASYGWTTADLVYIWKEVDPVQIVKDLNLPRFKLEQFQTTYCNTITNTGEYSCLKVVLVFKREFSYYLLTIYVPSCMLVIVSWVSFWLDNRSVPARVALGVTTLLTMSTQIAGVNRSLPPVAYTKAIDVWSGACVLFVFSALLEFAFVNYASRSDTRKGKLKRLNPLAQMLEMEEEESDSDEEIQKNLAKKREGGSSVGVELWGGDTPRHPVVSRLASTDRLLGPASPASSKGANGNGCRECERSHNRREYRKRMTPCTYLSRKFPTRSKRIDVIARFLFPIVFATFNLCYWIFYLSAERKTR